ncbi:D-alanyl-D-alanine carboxypeptidase [Streptococcus sp. X16XC17]|uniref:D-alanyl-D-alanine carboxypeptidase PBP3 n=1 Tax=unclassified Streptococcus TaxID=2608887 RepID=UPI00066FBE88|nr:MULTISPECIES: D-alanyl-D-alanine carboxypeptidase PBP3 [unclassified Streptococcus]TCD45595.1 D-alanyl-D-alanine carboxypeptidase [Streptococcus sp. X16XC17]
MKKYLYSLVAVLFSFAFLGETVAAADFSVAAKEAIVVEVSMGKVLYEQDASKPTYIASITKLLTIYLVYEAIEKGEISLDTAVEISDYPYQLTVDRLVSNVNLDARNYTVSELLDATTISSANSAAIALAEKISGSESAFVDRMKSKLKEWGITDATLVNATGLNNEFLGDKIYPGSEKNDENKLSAHDVAFIARRLLLDYPQVLERTSQANYTFSGITYANTNQMLVGGAFERAGVDGLKTGTTELAGASFVGTTNENGMRIITVILGATDGEEFPENRFVATNQLMTYAYDHFELTNFVEAGQTSPGSSIHLFNGREETAPVVARNKMTVVRRKNRQTELTANFKATQEIFDAPIASTTAVGTLTFNDDDLVGSGYLGEVPHVEMITAEKIETAIWPISWWNHFVRYANEKL